MSLRELKPDNAVLAIIDIQERLMPIMDSGITAQMVKNTNLFSRMFKMWQAPIELTEQYPRGLGHTLLDVTRHLPDVVPIEKLAFSAGGEPAFLKALAGHGRTKVVVVGMETHICVLQTVLDLIAEGYAVFVADDAVQSSSKNAWRSGLHLMRDAGAVVAPSQSLLFQMVGSAGTDEFRFFSKMLKEG